MTTQKTPKTNNTAPRTRKGKAAAKRPELVRCANCGDKPANYQPLRSRKWLCGLCFDRETLKGKTA